MNSRIPDPYGNRPSPLAHQFAEWLWGRSRESDLLMVEIIDIIHDLMMRSRRYLSARDLQNIMAASVAYVEHMLENSGAYWADLESGESRPVLTKEMLDEDPGLAEMEAAAYGAGRLEWEKLLEE